MTPPPLSNLRMVKNNDPTIVSFRLMFAIIASCGLAMLLTGCAATATSSFVSSLPGVSSQDLRNQTDVTLSEGNFVLIKTNIVGQSRGFALLGIITIVPAEFNTAFSRLYSQAGMESGKPRLWLMSPLKGRAVTGSCSPFRAARSARMWCSSCRKPGRSLQPIHHVKPGFAQRD